MTLPLLHNDCLYHRSSWFSLQCFLNWWCFYYFNPFFIWCRTFIRSDIHFRKAEYYSVHNPEKSLLYEIWMMKGERRIPGLGTANVLSTITGFIRITSRWFLQLHVHHWVRVTVLPLVYLEIRPLFRWKKCLVFTQSICWRGYKNSHPAFFKSECF